MTTLRFVVGVRRAPKVALPPGVRPPEARFDQLAEMDVELDDDQLAELAHGYTEIAFPVAALQGRVDARDHIAIRVGLPDHELIDGSLHPMLHIDDEEEPNGQTEEAQ
jgi:hypothetical protein